MSRPWWAAVRAASQTCPSLSSPSPRRTYVLLPEPSILDAMAIPTPIDSPCPSEPVLASTPGISMSGCPCSWLPISLRVISLSGEMYPASERTA